MASEYENEGGGILTRCKTVIAVPGRRPPYDPKPPFLSLPPSPVDPILLFDYSFLSRLASAGSMNTGVVAVDFFALSAGKGLVSSF